MTSPPPEGERPRSLAAFGRRSWLFIGIVVATAIVYSALSALSGLVVPLTVSVVLGVLLSPLVNAMARVKVPRRVAAMLVILGLALVAVLSVWVSVAGVIDQAPEIGRELGAGLDQVGEWIDDLGPGVADGGTLVGGASDFGSWLLRGMATSLSTVFSSAVAFLIGLFVGFFFLYYLLADWDHLASWASGHLGVPADLGRTILEDSMSAIRQYFFGLTISSVIVAITIGVTVAALGLPLAFTIGLVTFVTAYVPYLGAIFSGAFAFLVALGSGGAQKAFIVLAVVLVAQNLIQTLVQNRLTSNELSIHPIVNFGSTIVGAALAGILGATLSAPIVAILIRMAGRIRDYDWDSRHPAAEET